MGKLLVAILLLLCPYLFFYTDWFKIRDIDCQLNAYPCPLSLEPVLLNFLGQNIFIFKSGAAVRQIASFDPVLTDIAVRKRLPNRLKIVLVSREPVALVKVEPDGGEFFLDKTGFLYWAEPGNNKSVPEVYWPEEIGLAEGETAPSQDLAKLINTLAAYYVGYRQILRQPDKVYLIKTNQGPDAIINAETDYSSPVASLQFILSNIKMEEKLPGKIDLRFEKPVLTY